MNLNKNTNGTLYVDIVSEIKETISHPQLLTVVEKTLDVASPTRIEFTKGTDYQRVTFNDLDGISIIEGYLDISSVDGYFGYSLITVKVKQVTIMTLMYYPDASPFIVVITNKPIRQTDIPIMTSLIQAIN